MLKLLKVSGSSLLPVYRDGDFVLVCKIPILFDRLKPGDTVAFYHPEHGLLIKKVSAISSGGDQITVLGNHPLSVDSRSIGPVQREKLLGKVIAHIRKP